MSRDVVVRGCDAEHVTVVSREPGVPGEHGQLTMPVTSADSTAVRVSSSRPVILDGTIRHVLRLTLAVERASDVV